MHLSPVTAALYQLPAPRAADEGLSGRPRRRPAGGDALHGRAPVETVLQGEVLRDGEPVSGPGAGARAPGFAGLFRTFLPPVTGTAQVSPAAAAAAYRSNGADTGVSHPTVDVLV